MGWPAKACHWPTCSSGPIIFYVSLTPDAEQVLGVAYTRAWWDALNQVQSFTASAPDLG